MKKSSSSIGFCPECGSSRVWRSHRRGIKERLIKFFTPQVRFYRCHKCNARFLIDGRGVSSLREKPASMES